MFSCYSNMFNSLTLSCLLNSMFGPNICPVHTHGNDEITSLLSIMNLKNFRAGRKCFRVLKLLICTEKSRPRDWKSCLKPYHCLVADLKLDPGCCFPRILLHPPEKTAREVNKGPMFLSAFLVGPCSEVVRGRGCLLC